FLAVALRWFRPPMPDPQPRGAPQGAGSTPRGAPQGAGSTMGNRWERFMAVGMRRLGGQGEGGVGGRPPPPQRGALIAILAAIFLAMIVSHQLTPFLLLGGLIALLLFGRTTLRGFPLILAVTIVAWISLGAIAFWSGHLNLIIGDVGHL